MFEVHISDDFLVDGVSIYISWKTPRETRRLLRMAGTPEGIWEPLEPLATVRDPTLKLEDECARALLEALLRRYEGAADMHTVRSDLLHERGRVDKLMDAVTEIAKDVLREGG